MIYPRKHHSNCGAVECKDAPPLPNCRPRVFQEALEEGLVKGREEGIEKGIESVALRLIKMGLPIAEIARATDLTPAQIRKLSKKSQK